MLLGAEPLKMLTVTLRWAKQMPILGVYKKIKLASGLANVVSQFNMLSILSTINAAYTIIRTDGSL